MTSLSERLRSDLASLQNFIVAQRVHSITESEVAIQPPPQDAEDQHDAAFLRPRNPDCGVTRTESQLTGNAARDAQIPNVSASAAVSPATSRMPANPLSQLHGELEITTAQLHAERATVAQLRIQRRCGEAALQKLTEQAEAAEQTIRTLSSERDSWQRRCMAVEEQHAACVERFACLDTQFTAFQQNFEDATRRHSSLSSSVEELQKAVGTLSTENARLHEQLKRHAAETHHLFSVDVDLRTAQQRVHDFEAQQQNWSSEMQSLQTYFKSVKDEYTEGLQLVVAMRREYETLTAALAQRELECVRWETLFMNGSCSCHAPPATTITTTAVDTETKVEWEEAEGVCSAGFSSKQPFTANADIANAASPDEGETTFPTVGSQTSPQHCVRVVTHQCSVFTQQLEAKVADLAVQLYAAQTRATAAEQRAEQLTQLHIIDLTLLTELKAMVCVLRPSAESLAQTNAELQARLVVAEDAVEPLIEQVMRLAELYTEESMRRGHPQQQEQLGKEDSTPHANSSAAGEGANAVAAVMNNAHVPGKRHRLRATAFLALRDEQK